VAGPPGSFLGKFVSLRTLPAGLPPTIGGGCTAASAAHGFTTEFGDGCNNYGLAGHTAMGFVGCAAPGGLISPPCGGPGRGFFYDRK